MTPYLVQRGRFENRDYKKGIDSIVQFDYMGSSEFEFGELPKSLGKIREHVDQYIMFDQGVGNKTVTVFCKTSQQPEMKEYLDGLSKYKFRLKEYSDFDTYINPSDMKSRTDFWWDIENHLMFWRKDAIFESKFKTIIATKPA